jgi:hypothetical protein
LHLQIHHSNSWWRKPQIMVFQIKWLNNENEVKTHLYRFDNINNVKKKKILIKFILDYLMVFYFLTSMIMDWHNKNYNSLIIDNVKIKILGKIISFIVCGLNLDFNQDQDPYQLSLFSIFQNYISMMMDWLTKSIRNSWRPW